jgi:hypothetical protein
MSNIDPIITNSIASLEVNENLIQTYRTSFDSLISEQVKLFLELAMKVMPVIDHLKEKGHNFYNEEFDFSALNGPVIGRDDNFAYIYEGRGYLVTKYNYYNKESKPILLENFFASNSFKSAMDALLSVTKIQNRLIKQLQEEIDKKETELNLFK